MTQPIGYYASDPEDTGTLRDIATKYGARLEKLIRDQKYILLVRAGDELCDRLDCFGANLPGELEDALKDLSDDSLLGLMSATIEQLRHKELP
jgi:hypothetical protein